MRRRRGKRRSRGGGRMRRPYTPTLRVGDDGMNSLVIQFLNGLASASALFLVASGLTIIFGGTRIVNFPHGSFFMRGAVTILDQRFPLYELLLIVVGPAVLGLLWLLFHRTRWGTLVRAATLDREMVAALGVDQKKLFTGVFLLGAALAGLGGALQL